MSDKFQLSHCVRCRAPIYWMRTLEGKNIMVDAKGVSRLDSHYDPQKHTSHFGTCRRLLREQEQARIQRSRTNRPQEPIK